MKQAVLTRAFKIGINSRAWLKAGTTVDIEERQHRFVLHRHNYSGFIARDGFRWCDHQQPALFTEKK
jgi:hypothetical protein